MPSKSKVPKPGEHCQDVLCACNDFFIKVIHRFLCLVSCPKQGTVLRTQNLKSNRTAAGRAVKADRSPESFRGEERLAQHEPPDRCFFCVRLVTAILLDDLDRLQLHHPRAVLELVARVDRRVIGRLAVDHGGDDFEPAHS